MNPLYRRIVNSLTHGSCSLDILIMGQTRIVAEMAKAGCRGIATSHPFNQRSTMTSSGKTAILSPKNRVINKNMTLRYAAPASNLGMRSLSEAARHEETPDVTNMFAENEQRPLVVLLAWLMAGENHVEKYRQIYLKRGFDVLTVRTSPLEFMFPEKGSQKVARSMIEFLRQAADEYPKAVVHLFSVGAYQFGEVLAQVRKDPSLIAPLQSQIRGIISDSSVDIHGAPLGLAKSLAPKNPIAQKAIETSVRAYMKMMENIATRHYKYAQDSMFNNVLKTPALMLLSRRDPIATPSTNEELIETWKKQGIPVTAKWWDDTSHAAHYRKHPEEYESLITSFLKSINIHA